MRFMELKDLQGHPHWINPDKVTQVTEPVSGTTKVWIGVQFIEVEGKPSEIMDRLVRQD